MTNPKVALYFSGRILTYEHQRSHLLAFQKKYDVDIFCSINGVLDEYHQTFLDTFHVKRYHFEEFAFNEVFRNCRGFVEGVRPYNVTSSFYNNLKAMELIDRYQRDHGFVYDIIIKYRADIVAENVMELQLDGYEGGTLLIPKQYDWTVAPSFTGINDQIAYGDFQTMLIYSSAYAWLATYLMEEGVPFHPETLLYHHLHKQQMIDRIQRFDFKYDLNKTRHA